MKIYRFIICATLVALTTNVAFTQVAKNNIPQIVNNQRNAIKNQPTNNLSTNANSIINSLSLHDNQEPTKFDSQREIDLLIDCAELYLHKGDTLKAIPLLVDVALNNDVKAQYLVGLIYSTGIKKNNKAPDGKKAVYFLEMAAQQNNPDALALLSKIYRQGKILSPDYNKAKKYGKEAFDLGSSEGAFQLGLYYDVIEKEYSKAIALYQYVANDKDNPNNKFACYNLGQWYEFPENPNELNLEKAKQFYQKAIELGYEDARQNLDNVENKINASQAENNTGDELQINSDLENQQE